MRQYLKTRWTVGLLVCFATGILLPSLRGITSAEIENDIAFLRQAYLNCMWKSESGKIAAKQTETSEVKNFALRLIAHSSALEDGLAQLMKKKGSGLERDFDSTQKNTLIYLSRQQGAAIDREYMSMTADALSSDVESFKRAARQAKDPEIKVFAEKRLKSLKEDFIMAERILRNLPPPVLK